MEIGFCSIMIIRDLIFSQKIDKEKPFIGNFELKALIKQEILYVKL